MKIDTSGTEGKVEVMQAYVDCKSIEVRFRSPESGWSELSFGPDGNVTWHWGVQDYRIKSLTVEEAAVEYIESHKAMIYSRTNVELGFCAGVDWQKEQDNES